MTVIQSLYSKQTPSSLLHEEKIYDGPFGSMSLRLTSKRPFLGGHTAAAVHRIIFVSFYYGEFFT